MGNTNNGDKPRERETIKIEIYKDEKDEFLSKLYLLKIALKDTDFSLTLARNEEVKEHLRFLKKMLSVIHIPTIDEKLIKSKEEIADLRYIDEESEEKILDIKHAGSLFLEVVSFVSSSDKITDIYGKEGILNLSYFVCLELKEIAPIITNSDQYRESVVKKYSSGIYEPDLSVPIEISNLVAYALGEKVYDLPYLFNNKISHRNKYVVCVEVYLRTRHYFPELYLEEEKEGKDTSIKVITGYILSFFKGYGIMSKDEFILREKGKNSSYKRYLKKAITSRLNTAKTKYGFDYESLLNS